MTTAIAAKKKTLVPAGESERIQLLPIDQVKPNPDNPRRDTGDVAELAASIAAQGIQQALVVTPAGEHEYTLVIGHRRLLAARQAGLTRVPCMVRPLDEQKQTELMLVENVHRQNLTALEEAAGYAKLLDLGEDAGRMAKTTGRSERTVRRRLRVASIDEQQRAQLPPQLSFEVLDVIADYAQWPDLQAKLVQAAGTKDWNMTLRRVKEQVNTMQWVASTRQAVKQLGLPVVAMDPKEPWEGPDGYRLSSIGILTPRIATLLFCSMRR